MLVFHLCLLQDIVMFNSLTREDFFDCQMEDLI